MEDPRKRFLSETAGALTPELEGAARSRAHPLRLARETHNLKHRGDTPLAKTDSPSGPKRP